MSADTTKACAMCWGSGRHRSGLDGVCPVCRGARRIQDKKESQASRGAVACASCAGTGVVYRPTRGGGYTSGTCADCEGTGVS